MVTKEIDLTNGWIVEIGPEENGKPYTVLKIYALFGHGIYMPIDTRDFTQEQWDIFHARIEEMRK